MDYLTHALTLFLLCVYFLPFSPFYLSLPFCRAATSTGFPYVAKWTLPFGLRQRLQQYELISPLVDSPTYWTKSDIPRSWSVEGSNDGDTWEVIDYQSNQVFRGREESRLFVVNSVNSFAQ